MNPTPVPRGSIVVGVDGSPSSDAALDWAIGEAGRRHLRLHVIHAFATEYPSAAPPYFEGDRAAADPVLREALRRVNTADPEVEVTSEFLLSFPAATLVEVSRIADTVVVGARGRGPVRGALLGSVSTQVAMHARCPVVVVHEPGSAAVEGAEGPGRVVVGVDGSPVSSTAIGYAFAEASSRGVGLTVLHAWWLEFVEGVVATSPSSPEWAEVAEAQRLLVAESLAGWGEKYPDVEVRERVIRAHPVEALVEESEHAALVVVGSRGRGGFSALMLGSVSHGVLQRAHCPVAVVRSPQA